MKHCWWWHNWTKWEKIKEGRSLNYKGQFIGYWLIQERYCCNCGKIQRDCVEVE